MTPGAQRSARKIDLLGAPRLLGAHVKRSPTKRAGLGDAVDDPVGVPIATPNRAPCDLAVVARERRCSRVSESDERFLSVGARERARNVATTVGRATVEAPFAIESASTTRLRNSMAMYGVPFQTP